MCNKFTEDIIPTWTCHFPDYHKRDNFSRKCYKLCLREYLLRDYIREEENRRLLPQTTQNLFESARQTKSNHKLHRSEIFVQCKICKPGS